MEKKHGFEGSFLTYKRSSFIGHEETIIGADTFTEPTAKLVKVLAQLSTKRALPVCKLKEIKLISNLSHRHITQRADIHTWLFGEFSRVFAPSASRDLCWAKSPQSAIDLRRQRCRLRS